MFAKIFTKILDSSLADDRKLRHLFMDLLLLVDSDGTITQTESAIARRINAPVDEVREGIARLCEPDPNSQSETDEGRRLVSLDGTRGWLVVNYQQYRETKSKEDERQKTRDRVRRYRQRLKNQAVKDGVTPSVTGVTQCNAIGEGDGEVDGEAEEIPQTPKRGLTKSEKKVAKVEANTPAMIRIGSWFGRRDTTLWSILEKETLDIINPTEDEIELMEARYTSGDKYLRHDLITMLNNWQGELDKARKAEPSEPNYSHLKDGTRIDGGIIIGGKLTTLRKA